MVDLQELDGPRLIRPQELVASHQLSMVCFPGFVDEVDEETLLASYKPPRRGGIQVICRRGVPVSQIAIVHNQVSMYGVPLRIGSIGGVCTHPDYRGLGLATRLLDHCARLMAAEGARLMLVSGERGLYTRAGCVTAGEFAYVTVKPGQGGKRGRGLSLRPARVEDAALCSGLYQADPVHFVRPAETFLKHLDSADRVGRGDLVVEAAGRPVAYAFLSVPWDYMHNPGAGVREVFEYAGSRVALAGALPEIMARLELQELRLPVPWQEEDFLRLLEARGLVGDRVPMPWHTMLIVDLPGLMRDLGPYVRARLTASRRRGLRFEQGALSLPLDPAVSTAVETVGESRQAIVRGQERLALDGGTMTRLVMGVPSEVAPRPEVGSGALEEIVRALFPLPSFSPGLNYR